MNNLLQAIGGAMLLCIPVSFVLTIFYRPRWFRDFVETLVIMYLCLLPFTAVGFAGVVGIAMLTGAFR